MNWRKAIFSSLRACQFPHNSQVAGEGFSNDHLDTLFGWKKR